MTVLTPWQSRAERQAAIAAAAEAKQRSQADRTHAKEIERDIRSLVAKNHWAGIVADGLGIPGRGRSENEG